MHLLTFNIAFNNHASYAHSCHYKAMNLYSYALRAESCNSSNIHKCAYITAKCVYPIRTYIITIHVISYSSDASYVYSTLYAQLYRMTRRMDIIT